MYRKNQRWRADSASVVRCSSYHRITSWINPLLVTYPRNEKHFVSSPVVILILSLVTIFHLFHHLVPYPCLVCLFLSLFVNTVLYSCFIALKMLCLYVCMYATKRQFYYNSKLYRHRKRIPFRV